MRRLFLGPILVASLVFSAVSPAKRRYGQGFL
jgi:hypothetical protein